MRQKKLVYYGKKCLIFLISVFILSVAVFYVARLAPGDPLISYYGDRTEKMSPEEREWAMGKLGSVSYTHLDVYKRQAQKRVKHHRKL